MQKKAIETAHFKTMALAKIDGQEVEIPFEADITWEEPGSPLRWENMKITIPDGKVIDLGNDTKAAWENWGIDVDSMDEVHELGLGLDPNPYAHWGLKVIKQYLDEARWYREEGFPVNPSS